MYETGGYEVDLLEGESKDILEELRKVVKEPDCWLDCPNEQFGGVAPRDLLGTTEEELIRDAIRRIKHGVPL